MLRDRLRQTTQQVIDLCPALTLGQEVKTFLYILRFSPLIRFQSSPVSYGSGKLHTRDLICYSLTKTDRLPISIAVKMKSYILASALFASSAFAWLPSCSVRSPHLPHLDFTNNP
jgi:hypothetical protein